METDETKKRIRKKEDILKNVKDSIMIEEIVNEDIEKTTKSVKSPDNNMEKIIKSNKSNILSLAYQQGKIFEKFKVNENFIDMVKELGISKSTILLKYQL